MTFFRVCNGEAFPWDTYSTHTNLDATQLYKFSRSPGLRRFSISLLCQTGRTRRSRNSFAGRVANNWTRFPLPVAWVTEQRQFKKTVKLIILLIIFSHYSIFAPLLSLLALCPFPISKYVHTYIDNGLMHLGESALQVCPYNTIAERVLGFTRASPARPTHQLL